MLIAEVDSAAHLQQRQGQENSQPPLSDGSDFSPLPSLAVLFGDAKSKPPPRDGWCPVLSLPALCSAFLAQAGEEGAVLTSLSVPSCPSLLSLPPSPFLPTRQLSGHLYLPQSSSHFQSLCVAAALMGPLHEISGAGHPAEVQPCACNVPLFHCYSHYFRRPLSPFCDFSRFDELPPSVLSLRHSLPTFFPSSARLPSLLLFSLPQFCTRRSHRHCAGL
eukprot:1895928-Rhodomonas_salina.1